MIQAVITVVHHPRKGFLLLQRPETHKEFPLQWCHPGGKLDYITEYIKHPIPGMPDMAIGRWETYPEAAFRELKQETNIRPISIIETPMWCSDDKYIVKVFQVVVNDEQAKHIEEHLFPNDEHIDWGWFNEHFPMESGPMTKEVLIEFCHGDCTFDFIKHEEVTEESIFEEEIINKFNEVSDKDVLEAEIEDVYKVMKFKREKDGRWYIDLPRWTGSKAELEMVQGADVMLNLLLGESDTDTVELIVSTNLEKQENWLVHLKQTADHSKEGGGADYICTAPHFGVADFEVWLCNVTKWIYGYMPQHISLAYAEKSGLRETLEGLE